MTALLVAEDLTVGHPGHVVLQGVNFAIAAGARIWCRGPNGHGKTTLLATVAGALRPQSGRMHRHVAVGWMPQMGSLSPDLPTTLGEVVDLGGASAPEALVWTGLQRLRHQAWSASSGGERQRTLLARALAGKPRILLLDEPESHLDAAGRQQLADICAALVDRGGAWMAISHDQPPGGPTACWHVEDGRLRIGAS